MQLVSFDLPESAAGDFEESIDRGIHAVEQGVVPILARGTDGGLV